MNLRVILNIIGTTAFMAAIYFVSFVLFLIILTEWIESKFIGSTGGMEMTLILSFYEFIPLALLVNISPFIRFFDRVKHWVPLLLCVLFFVLLNGGFWPVNNRMIICALAFLTSIYTVLAYKFIVRRLRCKPFKAT